MGIRRRLGSFTFIYKLVDKVVSSPASSSTRFSRFRCSGRTYTVPTLKPDLAFSAYIISCYLFFIRPKNIGPRVWSLTRNRCRFRWAGSVQWRLRM
ncbi:hypothetical protein M413DRAFT_155081 [Hebeloma cylindrosporum]|uniref:Uncharacterized protein n=1 Tax=Hebeloma cylindrosporum TaxID=76867 RepID=A0A0C2XT67_HEBCY|nr:hypothetical protein M413DRAFT_155081 [Hebeloma cylindrosporum h7]